ncbi:MAG: hypothetical protein SynsKO_16790 [Synoicihabitans sp.]
MPSAPFVNIFNSVSASAMKLHPIFLLTLTSTLWGQFDYIGKADRDNIIPYQSMPQVRPADRIGWSADGNNNDPDDWNASPIALALFAAYANRHDHFDLANQFVHFSYNNRLDQFDTYKIEQNNLNVLTAAKHFGYDLSEFFDLWRTSEETNALPGYADKGVYPEYDAAVKNAVEHILASSDESRFFWIQAGPFEFAYRCLQEAVYRRGATAENLRNTILVSHSGINEDPAKWTEARDMVTHLPRPAAGAERCVNDFAEETGAMVGFLFTGSQGTTRFGGKDTDLWPLVDWMPESECAIYRWMHQRFLFTADFFQNAREKDKGRNGLDGSDAGMAFTLMTQNFNGNYQLWSELVKDFCPEGVTAP